MDPVVLDCQIVCTGHTRVFVSGPRDHATNVCVVRMSTFNSGGIGIEMARPRAGNAGGSKIDSRRKVLATKHPYPTNLDLGLSVTRSDAGGIWRKLHGVLVNIISGKACRADLSGVNVVGQGGREHAPQFGEGALLYLTDALFGHAESIAQLFERDRRVVVA